MTPTVSLREFDGGLKGVVTVVALYGAVNVWAGTQFDELMMGTAAVCVAVGTIWRYFFKPTIRAWRRIEAMLEVVQHEMQENSGKSVKDLLVQIKEMLGKIVDVEERVSHLERGYAWQHLPPDVSLKGPSDDLP